jgi:hypothetical protein
VCAENIPDQCRRGKTLSHLQQGDPARHLTSRQPLAELGNENLDRDTRRHAWRVGCWQDEIRQSWEVPPMSLEVNKDLIRRYLSASVRDRLK